MTTATARWLREIADDAKLAPGVKVRVYWGYGLGFRVQGLGTITKVFRKSVRVQLDEPVADPYGMGDGWPVGFELKGIPRRNSDGWQRYENGVELVG